MTLHRQSLQICKRSRPGSALGCKCTEKRTDAMKLLSVNRYLQLIFHVSIKLCYKILLSHAEQSVLMLLRKIVPVLCQGLQPTTNVMHLESCDAGILRCCTQDQKGLYLNRHWTCVQMAHGRARLLLPSTPADITSHELQLTFTFPQF